MKSKLKIGATFIAGKGVVATIYEIRSFDVIVEVAKDGAFEVAKDGAFEVIPIPRAIEYIEDGWWKFIANPNEIWKKLNEV